MIAWIFGACLGVATLGANGLLTPSAWRALRARVSPEPEVEPEVVPVGRIRGVPEFMYVTLPDGTVIRGPVTSHPQWGFPTTPPLAEWEKYTPEEESA